MSLQALHLAATPVPEAMALVGHSACASLLRAESSKLASHFFSGDSKECNPVAFSLFLTNPS